MAAALVVGALGGHLGLQAHQVDVHPLPQVRVPDPLLPTAAEGLRRVADAPADLRGTTWQPFPHKPRGPRQGAHGAGDCDGSAAHQASAQAFHQAQATWRTGPTWLSPAFGLVARHRGRHHSPHTSHH